MLKPYLLTIICCTLLGVCACNHPPENKAVNTSKVVTADTSRIQELVAKGKKFKSSNTDSLPVIAQALDSISRRGDGHTALIYSDIMWAYYYWNTTNYTSGMKHALQSLGAAEKYKAYTLIPEIYLIMANMHKENGNYEAAFKDCADGLNIAKANRDTTSIISLMGLRAMFTHGYYRKHGNYKSDTISLKMELDALGIAESSPKYERMRIRFYDNIAQTYKEEKQYNKALEYANKAVPLAIKYHQLNSLTYAYNWLGEAYYYMGQQVKGVAYMDSAVNIARRMKLPYRQMEIYEAMHYCYMSTKNYEEAIKYLKLSGKMRDSLQISKNEKQISEMQLKYNAGGKDKQIALLADINKLKSQKILRISVAMICFVVLMFVILYQYYTIHRYSRIMKDDNRDLNESLLKIAYIQSHQIRKPLASILGLVNIMKANDYEPDKEVLQKMEQAAQDLDTRIRAVIKEAEIKED
jgi:tetratricopeptide (TPR) repeat protein